jgi:hypothetical protein
MEISLNAVLVLCFVFHFDPNLHTSESEAESERFRIHCKCVSIPVLRIRDFYPGSRIRIVFIPDPNFFQPGSRIPIKSFKSILTQKLVSKLSEI